MRTSTNNYSYLIHKIDEFIRKYYLNQVVRGSLYLAASFFASYVIVATAEYFGNFSTLIRTALFYSFLLLNGFIFINWIFIPLLHYYRLGKTINHEQASHIIGKHFSHVKDKLLNTLQLKKLVDENLNQKELIEASINQKIEELKPVPFSTAIRFKENKKYLKYVLPPLAVLVFIGATAPYILSESTERLIKHDKKFVRKAPFQFLIVNKKLAAYQGDDFELNVKLTGTEIPQDIYLEDGVNTFKLEKENIINFSYTFHNIQNTKQIRLSASGFHSEPYTIEVKKKPTILNFDVFLEYPAYLAKKNESLSNSGDLTVPAGTKINWKFKTDNAKTIALNIAGKTLNLKSFTDNHFSYSYRALQSSRFSIKPLNGETDVKEAVSYNLTVIPDLHPAILLNEKPDSLNNKTLYFVGQISDDHGFSALKFNYRILNSSKSGKTISKTIKFDKNALQSNFFHVWNVNEAGGDPGSQIEYYFEVFDNDAVNGSKFTRSATKTFKIATEKESERKLEESSKAIQSKMERAIKKAGQVEKEAKKLNQDLLNKKNLSFEEKKQVEQLLEKQKELESLVNEISRENKQNVNERQDLKEQDRQLVEKQKQIEDLFNNVLDEKTRELLKNIEKLLDQNNKTQTQQELAKVQTDNKSLQKELDRILELYKQLEFDQKLSDAVDKLDKLAEKQNKLKEQTENNKANSQELKKQQDELNKDFDDVQNKLEELSQKNEELEKKNDFSNPEKEQEQIENQLDQSSKNLQNKNNKKAASNQQQASQQMKQLSEKLNQMQQENEQEENQVNMQSLREILDNLLNSSFDQEKVMQAFRNISSNDPNYVKLTQKQKGIKDNLRIVEDSLYALSKKAPQIESVVNKEIQDINSNIQMALAHLAERRTAEANRSQQYAMTSINNLALMLSEVQETLQRMMKNSQQGGKGKQKSLSQLSKMQEKLNENMQKARQQMQQGSQSKPGQMPGKGQMSEQLAKMAREQQMIRQALQEINRELNKDGKSGLGNLDKLSKEMEQSETDLVNKKIQNETLIRQQEILSKLLEAEKAERERELDTQRESKQGKDQSINYKIVLEEFKKLKQNEVELLKTVPPSLNTFYKLKVGDYFRLLNTN